MVKGLYTAFTGMINEQHRMDVLTNNLANAATNGYKKEGATSQAFDDILAYKIKDASDTNSDFDDLAESIQAGYYLKNGLSSSEEFYYLCVLVTVTGYSAREVEWRAREMKKLLNAQDMDVVSCIFKEEQAFRSALPLLDLDRSIYERSKRNVLTSGAASC